MLSENCKSDGIGISPQIYQRIENKAVDFSRSEQTLYHFILLIILLLERISHRTNKHTSTSTLV